MEYKRSALFTLVLLLVATATAHADKVDAYIKAEMQKQHIPGLSLAVVKNGKVSKARGYGPANVELNVHATPDTVYEIGSITKQFTATAIMMLVEEGKVGLDEKIIKYLDGLPEAWKEVTVRHLLTHTSGVKSYTGVPNFMRLTVLPTTREEVIKTVAGYPLEFQPGERWSYSNTGYYLLGLIIEKASGKSYADFLKERIFTPLKMTSTTVNDLGNIIKNRAGGYVWRDNMLHNADAISMTWPYAAGALVSTVTDLAKWDAALYTEKLLKKSSLEQMWTPVKLNSGKTHSYGFGWGVDKVNGHTNISHGGGIPGFTTFISRFPDDKITVIVLTNQLANPGGIARGVAGFYIPALAPPVYKRIEDKEPKVTALVKEVVLKTAEGNPDPNLFTPETRADIFPDKMKQAAEYLKSLGPLKSLELVERKEEGGNRAYRYRLLFKDTSLFLLCTLNKEDKIAGLQIRPE